MHSRNRVSRLLEIDYPIIQGGMAWVSDAVLAAAVSNAGGLVMLASGNMPADRLSDEIDKARSLTDRPFGVNVMLLSPFSQEVLQLVARKEVQVVTLGAGNPGKAVGRLKYAGVTVIPIVASVAQARRAESMGADMIVAEGMEAGGHIGRVTTMALVPQVVDSVDIPVIAAGGIADGRGMAAVFCLGAEGVQIGTRFICSEECQIHENYKKRVVKASELDAVITGTRMGHPIRALRNNLTRRIELLEKKGAGFEEIEKIAVGGLEKAVREGDVDSGSVMAGQISGLVRDIRTVEEIIQSIIQEFYAISLERSEAKTS